MTTVKITPGACGLITTVTADSEDQMEVRVSVQSACPSIQKMLEKLGDTFDAFDICLSKPGANLFYEFASEHLPGHASCPTIAGIIKCMEVECKLALPKDAAIQFQ